MKTNNRTNRYLIALIPAKRRFRRACRYVHLAAVVGLFVFFFLAFMQSGRIACADAGGYHVQAAGSIHRVSSYTIQDYHVQAELQKNNVLEITETLQVHFNEKRHGIYRNIPTHMYVNRDTSKNLDGSSSRVLDYANKIRNLSIDGWKYDTEYENGNYVIRIGDEDTMVEGDQTYRISYRYVMPDDRITNSDFFFYSVLGSGWNTTIQHFSFDISFEKALPNEAQSALQIYSGKLGADENALHVMYDLSSTEMTGEVYDIAPNQAVTIFTNLPQGYYEGASKTPSLPFKISLVLTILLGICMLAVEFLKRDRLAIQTIEFHPPEGMSSAEVGTIIDESVDDIDMMSLLPWWADQGYIAMEEVPDKKGRTGKHGHFLLHLLKPLSEDTPDYQKTLFKALFPKDREIADLSKLKNKFAKKFDKAKNQLQLIYTGDKKLSKGTGTGICLLTLLCITYSLVLGFSSQVSLVSHLPFGIISGVALLLYGVIRICLRGRDPLRKIGGWVALSVYGLCTWILAMVMVFLCGGPDSFLPTVLLVVFCCLSTLAVLNIAKFVHFSAYKQEMMGKLMGLRQFIQTAELPQLKMLVDENPTYYYGILPYAMAFGMMDDWAKRFEGMTIPEPDWYQSNDHTMFTLMYLNHQMNHHIQKPIQDIKVEAAAAEMKATAFSSSAGGGFSGGGAVGGGGGSW